MSSLFAVLPAAALDSAEQAYERYLSLVEAPEPSPPERAVGVVCTLIHRSGTGLRVHRRPDARGALLEATVRDRFDCLRALLALTADRDLAVLDVATRRLYNPRGATRIQVTTGNITLPYLTESILDEILETPPDPRDPTLQVTRAPMCHIRARRLPDEIFELEHRDLDAFFQLFTDNAPLVRKTIWAWAIRDPWWQQAIAWQPVDTPVAPRRRPVPEDDIDTVLAELRRMADEPPPELGALELLSTFGDLDSRTQAILDRPEPDAPERG
ncbi:hypothetical protein [Nocardia carnea]|uniref:Uncharacterized protein n=1 Tax=Nocardia carnea TaxID=37328 RepID=A0ABW7TIY5_9NOCA|nr:hypothetical protein [Nocardia carnea]